MSKRIGPTVRGTKKDGTPRVFHGQLVKVRTPTHAEYRLSVVGAAHMSRMTAEGFELVSFDALGPDRLGDLDVHMDYFDAANEDAHGRLPHEAGYGSPLRLLPDPPANVIDLPTPDRQRGAA